MPTESSKEKKEGAFYVWTYDEIYQNLNKPLAGKDGVTEADIFCFHFSVQKHGNVDVLKVHALFILFFKCDWAKLMDVVAEILNLIYFEV